MQSAEGQVQNLRYTSTFPLLINVSNQPTYFMALKDGAGLVKKFAMIDIQRYQNVAVGDTVADTQKVYEALLATNGVVAEGEGGATDVVTVKGTIRSMNQAVIEGNTHFYLTVEGEDGSIFDFALPIAPSFYKLDLSELPVMICTFYLGPVSGVVCEFLKILLKLLIKGTSTAFVGDLANFLVGCSFVLPASICYQATLSKKGAIWSLTLGTLVMTVFGSLFNAWYLIPQFVKLFHMPLESIIAAGTAIFSSVTDLKTLVLFCIVPFNLIKGAAVSVLTFLLYKRVEGVFFRRKKNADSQ